jgi:hypothetical protein
MQVWPTVVGVSRRGLSVEEYRRTVPDWKSKFLNWSQALNLDIQQVHRLVDYVERRLSQV